KTVAIVLHPIDPSVLRGTEQRGKRVVRDFLPAKPTEARWHFMLVSDSNDSRQEIERDSNLTQKRLKVPVDSLHANVALCQLQQRVIRVEFRRQFPMQFGIELCDRVDAEFSA